MSTTKSTINHTHLYICYGQNCRDVGGSALAEQYQQLGGSFKPIACQSLCSYAPTAKFNGVAILRANLDKILDIT